MDPIKLSRNKKSLVVFDDCVNLKNQDKMKAYFTRGRHSSCNVIYLSQNFYELDKNSIRGNSNFYIFFELGNKDRDMIFRDLFSNIMSKECFNAECHAIRQKEYNYIAFNLNCKSIFDSVFNDPIDYE